MFQSYTHTYLNYKDAGWNCEITIIDDDFIETGNAMTPCAGSACAAAALLVLIDIYSEKNLPIVPNIFLLHQYIEKKHPDWKNHILYWWKKYIPQYNKYYNDLQTYLIFT